ncbi:hypothetical protein CROQUDRAFT_650446, partial [Cronartium quercuum f. sp. fusiforme G11]
TVNIEGFLDNAAIHHGAEISRLCADHGVRLEYLPLYCPELSSIELGYGVIKMRLQCSQALIQRHDQFKAIQKMTHTVLQGPFMEKIWVLSGYNRPFGT